METAIAEADLHDLLTIKDFIRWSMSAFQREEIFFGHGTDSAWDEALGLVLHVVDLPIDVEPLVFDARMTQQEKQMVLQMLRSRVDDRIPLAYLTQTAWFAGLKFFVDERVLIPRSPIAELIEQRYLPWAKDAPDLRILDLCTGSGCIAIATAMVLTEAIVDAVDNSSDALAVARRNVEDFELQDQVHLIESDLFAQVTERYDIIVSNPPYVSQEEYDTLPEEYTQEPESALLARDQGLELVIKILAQASEYLTDDGVLIVEVGNSSEALCQRFPDVPFTWLDFSRGGDGVFVLSADILREFHQIFNKA